MAAHTRALGNFHITVNIDPSVVIARAEAARAQALPVIGEYIRARSTAIAPKREGHLTESARVEPEAEKVRVYYGEVYAAYQHEGVNFRHPNGRKAKYLESVMNDPATAKAAETIFAGALKAHL